jgi:D-alanine transaminase
MAEVSPASTVYLNGEYVALAEARIPVLDRGFIFGDGVYEVVPVYGRVPFRWQAHYARLERSLAALRLPNPYPAATWQAIVAGLIERHPWDDQFVYLHLTRGVARRDHAFPQACTPTVFAMTNPWVPTDPAALAHGVAAVSGPDERWLHCHIKSTALLGNVLARQSAVEAGAVECLLFRDGYLTEGAASNIWVVRAGRVYGHPPDHHVLEGIRYGLLSELCAAEGIEWCLQAQTRAQVAAADELLLTSATKEVLPITQLDGQPVGQGTPGPVFKRLYAAYQRAKAHSTTLQGKA